MSDEPEQAAPAAEPKTRKPAAELAPEAPVAVEAVEAVEAAPEVLIPTGHVMVRVLPMGHGKVYKGEDVVNGHTIEARFPTYQRGDQFVLQQEIAEAQEAAGRVEILP